MTGGDSQKKDFTLSRAKAAVLSRDFDLAARLYKGLLKAEPDNQELLHELAAMYVRGGQDEKALDVYNQILEKKGDDFDALTNLGGIYRRLNRYDESIAALDKALSLDPDNVQVHYNLGFTYKLMEMYQDALECFNIVIGANPNDILAYNQLGSIHSLLGDSKSAIASYRRGLQLDPNHPVLHFNLARELEGLGHDDEAKNEYESALRAKPGWSDALNGYALFLMSHNKYAEAYETLLRGIKVSPDDTMLQSSMGTLQLRRGEYADAEDRFKSVLSRDSHNHSALFGLADVYSKVDKPEKANQVLEHIKECPPKTEDGQIRYARSLLTAKHLTEGGTLIKKLWDSNRSSTDVMNLVAEYYACCNDIPRLKACLKRMASSESGYYQHYLDIAERFRQNGNLEEAQLYIQQYLEHRPDDTAALSALASCYEMLQKYQEALSLYRKALSSDKYNSFLQTAIQRTSAVAGSSGAGAVPVAADAPSDDGMVELAIDVPEEGTVPQDSDVQDEFDSVFSDDGEVELASDRLFDDYPSMQVEPQSEEEDEIIFNLDNIADNFSGNEDVYDPLELEPMDLEPLEDDGVDSLDALTFDGSPVDYEPSADKPEFDSESDLPSGLDFEADDIEVSEDIDSEDMKMTAPETVREPYSPPEPPVMPHRPQYQQPYPAWEPPPAPVVPPRPAFEPEPVQKPEPVELKPADLEPLPRKEPEVLPDAQEAYSADLPLDANPIPDDVRNRLPELFEQLVDRDVEARCDSAAGLFRHMRKMCEYLPPLQKEAFVSGRKRVQLDFIIERLTGRPGLLASAEAIRRNGFVDIPEERYDIVEKFDEAAVTGRVFSSMRNFIHELPDKDVSLALDSAVTDILERLAVANSQ